MNWIDFFRDIGQLLIAIFVLGFITSFVIAKLIEEIYYVITGKNYSHKDRNK